MNAFNYAFLTLLLNLMRAKTLRKEKNNTNEFNKHILFDTISSFCSSSHGG